MKLLADRTVLDQASVFQVPNARKCASCTKRGLVNFQFFADVKDITGKALSIEVHCGALKLDPKTLGDPSINVRLLFTPTQDTPAHVGAKRPRMDAESGEQKARRTAQCPVAAAGKK